MAKLRDELEIYTKIVILKAVKIQTRFVLYLIKKCTIQVADKENKDSLGN